MQSTLSFSTRSRNLVAHIWNRLKETPLLLGWLVIGLLVTAQLEGWTGLLLGLANLLLLGLYVLLIRALTPAQTAPPPSPVHIQRPRLELSAALALFGLLFLIQLLDFGVWTLQPLQGWVQGFFAQVRAWVHGLGLPGWIQPSVTGTVSSTIKQLIPTLLLFWIFRCGRHSMGLARPHLRLTAALVGITTAFGLLAGVLLRAPLGQVLALYATGIFINALPEELFFRGMLLPRLEKFFANPLNALVVSALLFNAMHVPLDVTQGEPLLSAVLGIFRVDYPTGLLWGYLYLRTRSILPGLFWHAANGRLGFIFLDF